MRFIYSLAMLDFLRQAFLTLRVPALTVAFNSHFGLNKSPSSIKAALHNHQITCGRFGGLDAGSYLDYSDEKTAFITQHYPLMSMVDLAVAFNAQFGTNKTPRQLAGFAKRKGISSGRTGRFKQGRKNWNTGTRGICKPNSGSFKHGSVPTNHLPVGSEVVNTDGYYLVKVAEPRQWAFKHELIWREHHGDRPKGMIILFKDSDRLHCDISNLGLISRAENLHLNRINYHTAPLALRDSLLALAKLECKRFEKVRAKKYISAALAEAV